MHILAADDEAYGLSLLTHAIQKAVPDADISAFQSAHDALEHARRHGVHAAFLDVRMPEMDGLSLAVELKKLHPKINIIFVTGYGEYTGDAFALHASGYVHKPVSWGAIAEQMENLRFAADAPALIQALGPYTFDPVTQRAYCHGRDMLLGPREFRLFGFLASHPEVYFTPEKIYQRVWGDEPLGNVHTVYVRVSALRKKLDTRSGYTIEQKRNLGYRLTRLDGEP